MSLLSFMIMIIIAGHTNSLAVYEAVETLTAQYYQFGLGLDILPNILDDIKHRNSLKPDAVAQLREVVRYRISQENLATWNTFADAIDKAKINRQFANGMATTKIVTVTRDKPGIARFLTQHAIFNGAKCMWHSLTLAYLATR